MNVHNKSKVKIFQRKVEMSKKDKTIVVLIGTVRQNRASEGVANWLMRNLPKTKHTKFELVDLRDWQLPFFDEPMPPLASQGSYEREIGKKWLKKVAKADGFIIITGEYNHGVPGVLKNALDYWYSGLMKGKPVSFVSYGAAAGGTRAVEQLRLIVSELRLIALHDEVNIPAVWAAFKEDDSIVDDSKIGQLHNLVAELDGWFE